MLYLSRCQSSEGEHANLAGDEGPVLVRVQLLQVIPQHLAHCLCNTAEEMQTSSKIKSGLLDIIMGASVSRGSPGLLLLGQQPAKS